MVYEWCMKMGHIRWLTPAVIDILPRLGSGQICPQNADTPQRHGNNLPFPLRVPSVPFVVHPF